MAVRLLALVCGLVALGVGAMLLWPAASPATTASPKHVVIDGSVLGFPGATSWTAQPCDERSADEVCLGQWRHEDGQVARVLLLPLPDPSKLDTLAARLADQARASGGVAEAIDVAGQRVFRMLQPMRDADNGDRVIVALTYVIPAPDRRSLHLLTSSTPLEHQEPSDQRLRDLLAFGAWLEPAQAP